jgi:hypothetical protein
MLLVEDFSPGALALHLCNSRGVLVGGQAFSATVATGALPITLTLGATIRRVLD